MSRRWLLAAAALVAPARGAAQVDVAAQVTHVALEELAAGRQWSGFGVGASVAMTIGRVEAELTGQRADLDPDAGTSGLSPFTLSIVSARVSVRVFQFIDLEGGVGRHSVDPELAAQDVGYVRVGLRAAGLLAPRSRAWVRAAYLPVVRFSGGGDPGLAMETGFGVDVGLGSRLGLHADYLFQRMDRSDGGVEWPTQVWTARLGASVSFE